MASDFKNLCEVNRGGWRASQRYGEPRTVETLVDPGIQMVAFDPAGKVGYAYEVADAVEEQTFNVDGIPISNFVYPSWFEGFRKKGSTNSDYLNQCNQPYQLMKGGYIGLFKNGKWTEKFGSKMARKKWNPKTHGRQRVRKIVKHERRKLSHKRTAA